MLINETVSRPTFYQKDTEPHTVYCCTFAITEAVLSTLPGTDGITGSVKPFNGHIKTAVQRPLFSNTVGSLVHWPLMGGLLHLVQREGASSIAGTKMIPPPSNKTPQTPSHLPHPTTVRYSDFLDFSWGPVSKV